MSTLPPPQSENPSAAPKPSTHRSSDLSHLPPFEMSFSLPLHCNACITSVQTALLSIPGILRADLSLESQTLRTLGTAAPSAILAAIQTTGRDAVVRGAGAEGSGQAAVAILEDYDTEDWQGSGVRGLARIVQLQTQGTQRGGEGLSVVDITVSGLRPGSYKASIRASGDISKGSRSVGAVWRAVGNSMEVGEDGRGSAVVVGQGWEVWEIVGRAFAIERVDQVDSDKGMVLGVIARSAGVWDNDKMVCSCSGKTVWEERVEQKNRGML